MKTLKDLLTLAILLNLTQSLRRLPMMLLNSMVHGLLVWLVLLGSVLAVLDYEARAARSGDLNQSNGEQVQYQDESQPARIHLTPIHP